MNANDGLTAGAVRLQYIGDQVGAVSFTGPGSNREYRAGDNDQERYIDVHPNDVGHLVGLGLFKVLTFDKDGKPVEQTSPQFGPNEVEMPGLTADDLANGDGTTDSNGKPSRKSKGTTGTLTSPDDSTTPAATDAPVA